MRITKETYEAYLLDHLEGTLTPEDEKELRSFLALHPECRSGLQEDDVVRLPAEAVEFPDADGLKKEWPRPGDPFRSDRFDLFSIARMEGDLDDEQLTAHEDLVGSDEAFGREWTQWKQTRLSAVSVVFPGKDHLKKGRKTARVRYLLPLTAAAAVTLLFVLVRPFEPRPFSPPQQSQVLRQDGIGETTPVDPEGTRENLISEVPVHAAPVVESVERKRPRTTTAVTRVPAQQEDRLSEREAYTSVSPDPDALSPRALPFGGRLQAYVPEGTRTSVDRIVPLAIPAGNVHLRHLSLAQLAGIEPQDLLEAFAQENELTLVDLAQSGIQGINRLTGARMDLQASRDEAGDLSGFRFRSRFLTIDRSLNP
ncbi:MAG: hypothetical protein R2751_03135 [Bacteroidales bacterium]